jgi:hypothetical protein
MVLLLTAFRLLSMFVNPENKQDITCLIKHETGHSLYLSGHTTTCGGGSSLPQRDWLHLEPDGRMGWFVWTRTNEEVRTKSLSHAVKLIDVDY